MEISQEGKDAIRTTLRQFMSDDEAERFIDLEYTMDAIKQGRVCWQAPVSIGIHAAQLYLPDNGEGANAALSDLIGLSLEPLEALLQLLSAVPDEETPMDERARTLFHTHFSLGLLLLAKGEKQRAKAILHEVSGTKVSIRGREFISGPDVIQCNTDIYQAKWHTAWNLLKESIRQKALDHEELLYALVEAAACAPPGAILTTVLSLTLLDKWTEKCNKPDTSQEDDYPDMGWLNLFTAASELFSFCSGADTAGDLPNKCEMYSPQYVAWEFGQIAGSFAVPWSKNPLVIYDVFPDDFRDDDFPSMWGPEPLFRALCPVQALLIEFAADRDWGKARQQYVEMWQICDRWNWAALSEIGPESDLYWAIRIGFADKVKEILDRKSPEEPDSDVLLRDIEEYLRKHSRPGKLDTITAEQHVPSRSSVIRRGEPYLNIVRLRETLRQCEQYIFWADPHFRTPGLEALAHEADPNRISSIRILSLKTMFTNQVRREWGRFKREMAGKRINVEWRIVDRMEPHDRFIIGANIWFNVPPVQAITEGSYSEIHQTRDRPPFEEWWDKASPSG